MSTRKGLMLPVQDLDAEEEVEECGVTDYVGYSKDAIVSFNFINNAEIEAKPTEEQKPLIKTEPEAAPVMKPSNSMKFFDNRTQRSQPYGITPPVDGERFEVRRTFLFRRSTVKLLNKLKAEHDNENVYLSTIVDEAIRFYYENAFKTKQGGNL